MWTTDEGLVLEVEYSELWRELGAEVDRLASEFARDWMSGPFKNPAPHLVTTRFLADVDDVESVVHENLRPIEKRLIQPDSEYEFGYVGRHFILFIPTDVSSPLAENPPIRLFELQIKTLFQYAWSETNHKFGYKQLSRLDIEERKLTAYIAAQAWGADRAVNELYEKMLKKLEDGAANA